MKEYSLGMSPKPRRRLSFWWVGMVILVLLVASGLAYKFLLPTPAKKTVDRLEFDASVTESDKQAILAAVESQAKSLKGSVQASVKTALEADQASLVMEAYVPVTGFGSPRQNITKDELGNLRISAFTTDENRASLANALGIEASGITSSTGDLKDISDNQVVFIPADRLTSDVKLLSLEGSYYLDTFQEGGVFRQAIFTGEGADVLADLKLNQLPSQDVVFKVNMTGVTALTRVMMRRLSSNGDPKFFSDKIGDFLADADITHVSNEVSFKPNCQYSNVSFCSPPEFIETLKDSGVDLVELTGNHNNDQGNTYNTDSINLYHSLGWGTFGGGLNTAEAAKPYIADKKGSKVTFIGYNMADGLGSGAIARDTTAGANFYTEQKAKADIEAAKQNSDFVVVNIQYAECQAYPGGYVEFPVCDGLIGGQQEAFRKMIDLGADMVVGSSAHQPQTYELYEGKPIYYGLGNMYFDQTEQPGTERDIILTHYFTGGKLLQTKVSPTVFGKELQPRLMNAKEATYILGRLKAAQP